MNLVLPQDFDREDAPSVLERARQVLDLPPDAKLQVQDVTQSAHGTKIDFTYTASVALDANYSSDIAGIHVQVSSHGELKFDARGSLMGSKVQPPNENQVRALGDNLSKLVQNGQVYFAKPDEQIDPNELRALGKAWVVQEDASGKKCLRRAWIS